MPESASDGIRILQITPALAMAYKQARLQALADSPSAFCSTYDGESQHADSVWIERSDDDPEERVGFLAIDDARNEPVGLVRCFLSDRDPSCAVVISFWVAPSCRGSGLSTRLLEAITQWAESHDFVSLTLLVTNNNARAIAFYERHGFVRSGLVAPYPNDPALHQFEMARPLRGGVRLAQRKNYLARWVQLGCGLLLLRVSLAVGGRAGILLGAVGIVILIEVVIRFVRRVAIRRNDGLP